MTKIRFNPMAISDMQEIKEYISQDNPEAAIRITNNIFEKIQSLAEFPKMGAALDKKIGISTKYRYLVCDKYIAFYILEDDFVSIMRILHGKRDCLSLLDLQ